MKAKDTSGVSTFLRTWEKENPKDAELFISYFNYYYQLSERNEISISEAEKGAQSLVITDTSNGKEAGFLNFSSHYIPALFQKSMDYIDRGIKAYPDRLDMRFGKIYALGQAGKYHEFTTALLETIDYSNTIKEAWIWADGKALEDGANFFLSSMQDYINTLYNANDDSLLPLMRQIAEAILRYHPDHVESLSNVALTYTITREYDKAIPYLLKAEKIAPNDVIVINNLAEVYSRKNDKVNAKSYYNKLIEFGNEDDKQFAREKLKKL